jgi:hypothetical protein
MCILNHAVQYVTRERVTCKGRSRARYEYRGVVSVQRGGSAARGS